MPVKIEYKRGRRAGEHSPLYYDSRCGEYRIIKSDRCEGITLPVIWLACYIGEPASILARKRTRSAAEAVILQHARVRALKSSQQRKKS